MEKLIINNAKIEPISSNVTDAKSNKIEKMKEAHLTRANVTRTQTETRAFPLTEKTLPHNGTADSANRIIEFLNVPKSHRYLTNGKSTFCNIYAHDFASAMGAYVPRVWWTEAAIKSNNMTKAVYAGNVTELNANALYEWFPKYGRHFGWAEVENVTEAQKFANEGKCVIAVAANKDRKKSGHIVGVVPEDAAFKAVGALGVLIYPVQTQAGVTNKKKFVSNWWASGHDKLRIYVKN